MPSCYLKTAGENPVYEGLDRNHPSSCSEADQTAVDAGIIEVVEGNNKEGFINNNFITYKFALENEDEGEEDGYSSFFGSLDQK